MNRHYKSLFISDTHIGSYKCRQSELVAFLKHVRFNNLFIIGDFVHGDSKQFVWNPNLIKYLLELQCPVVYTTGNHDDFVCGLHDLQLKNWYICRDYIYESNGHKILLDHGHSYHYLQDYSPEVKYHIGSKVYKKIIFLGILASLVSSSFKRKFIKTINSLFFRGFREHMVRRAKARGCTKVASGHVHLPCLSKRYMNCGDWVGNNTAIGENYDGTFELIKYKNGKIEVLQNL